LILAPGFESLQRARAAHHQKDIPGIVWCPARQSMPR
jgi:hypothetical protein